MSKRTRLEQLKELGWGVEEICELLEELKASMQGQESVNQAEADLEMRIVKIVNDLGIPIGLSGRYYIIQGLKFGISHCKFRLTEDLYPYLAKEFFTTPCSIEKAIKYTIKTRVKREKLLHYADFTDSILKEEGNVKPREFFHVIISYLKETK